jgi:Xaa-Pro aminopeptidase
MEILTPKEEVRARIGKLKSRLAVEGLDGALFHYALDIYYFTGTRQNSVLWVPTDGEPVLLIRKSFNSGKEGSLIKDVRPFPASKDLPGILSDKALRIGLALDVLPVQHFNFYKGLLEDREFSDISAINRELRSVKSIWELELMRISGARLAAVFSLIPEFLRPGMRELDLAAEFEYRLRKEGLGGFLRMRGFNQEITGIAVSGGNAAVSGCFDGPITGKGHWRAAPYGPSTDVIGEGVPIVVDYGGSCNGYLVDMTRMFCFGRLDNRLKEALSVSYDIQAWIRDNLRPGNICEEIYNGAAGMAADAGLLGYFMGYPGETSKFVGHGVGLELDELPVLAPKFKAPLQAGQTVAVEPKFLFPGLGAVGIENTFAVTEGGGEKLTDLVDDIMYL